MLQAANRAITHISWQETLLFTTGPLAAVLQCQPFLSCYTVMHLSMVTMTTCVEVLYRQCCIFAVSVYIAANDHILAYSGAVGDAGVVYRDVASLLPPSVYSSTITATAAATAAGTLKAEAGVSLSPEAVKALWSTFLSALPSKATLYTFYTQAKGAVPGHRGVLSSLGALLFKGEQGASTVEAPVVGVCSTAGECAASLYTQCSAVLAENVYYLYERITYWSIRCVRTSLLSLPVLLSCCHSQHLLTFSPPCLYSPTSPPPTHLSSTI